MEQLKLGQIIEDEQKRDAIHIAVAPVVAGQRLSAGQDVGLVGEEAFAVKEPIGIVDPFIKGRINKGERFWLFLYPYTITSLRHDWTHPAFENNNSKAYNESKIWMENFASSVSVTVDELLRHGADYLNTGDYWCEGSRFESKEVPDNFWYHFEVLTGRKVREGDKGSFFSCSC